MKKGPRMRAFRVSGAIRRLTPHDHAAAAGLDVPSHASSASRENPHSPPSWRLGSSPRCAAQLARHEGASRLGATLYELEPGAAASPLHFHHRNEELLFVLSGTPTLRTGADSERSLAAGAVVAFPPGREGTHQVLNRSDEPVRVLICSSNDVPEVAEQVETGLVVLVTEDGGPVVPAGAVEMLGES